MYHPRPYSETLVTVFRRSACECVHFVPVSSQRVDIPYTICQQEVYRESAVGCLYLEQ